EALPVRMADTLLANYIRCLTSAASYAYEEVLELPRGVRHARTTLSPIFSDGADLPRRVVGIVGVSTDITDHKHDLRRLTAAKAHLRRQCEDVATAATAMAQRMRGPLSLILSLAETCNGAEARAPDPAGGRIGRGRGSRRPTDPLAATHTLIQQTAREAIQAVDRIETATARRFGPQELRAVDLSHIVRDRVALIDPDGLLAVTYPRLFLRTDADLIENALERGFEIVSMDAASFVRLTVDSATVDMDRFRMRLTFDANALPARAALARRSASLAGLEQLLTSHGGSMATPPGGAPGETILELSLPGRVDFTGLVPSLVPSAKSSPLSGAVSSGRSRRAWTPADRDAPVDGPAPLPAIASAAAGRSARDHRHL
ncbi:MAG: hypothetical protein AAGG09_23035, partial [Pseudomonadota bacterium]